MKMYLGKQPKQQHQDNNYQWLAPEQQQGQTQGPSLCLSPSKSGFVIGIAKLAAVLALVAIYNQLIVYQIDTKLRRGLERLDGDNGELMRLIKTLRQQQQYQNTSQLTRTKRESSGDHDDNDEADDSFADLGPQDSREQSSSGDWLYDYLTGNSRLETSPSADKSRKKQQQGGGQDQCLCPPGE